MVLVTKIPPKAIQPAVATSAAPQRSPSVSTDLATYTIAPTITKAAPKNYAVTVAAWMDEVEASAPPPHQLAFSIHRRRQAARLVELLGG